MLWLGFGGELVVKSPAPAGYWTTGVVAHDRLTISDTANVVKWFIMRHDVGITGQIQDPEWSTHPDYIACLGQVSSNVWDGKVVRISDKAYLKFNDGKLDEISTPHIRVPDSVRSSGTANNPQWNAENGFVDRESIREFFGTYDVVIAYTRNENGMTLYYIDYNETNPAPVRLLKPADKQTWKAESPLISPDGKWVAYNCYENTEHYYAYIQELSPASTPYLVEDGGCDPHWWIHPADRSLLFIVYARLTGAYYTKEDYLDATVQRTASAGVTVKQQVKLFAGLPAHAGLQFIGVPQVIAPLPFKGGMSRDGRYLSTGYAGAYLMKLE